MAELNWKPSPVWPGTITTEHEEWYSDAKTEFPPGVFKKISGVSQFLGQGESDVFGVRFVQGKTEKIIATDIAFHTRGLQYGSKSNTAANILKKMFRAAITVDVHFPDVAAEIIFLSPKVNPAAVPGVLEASQTAKAFFKNRRSNLQFHTIINEDFKTAVLDNVAPLSKKVADTSELYLRATQLADLFTR